MNKLQKIGIAISFIFLLALVGCGKSATFHKSALESTSATIKPGDLTRSLTLPSAMVVEFKYALKDGKIDIVKIYEQNRGIVKDSDIIDISKETIDEARKNNVSVYPKQGYMLDFVTINTNGTYACPFPSPGGDMKTYQGTTSTSVFYDHAEIITDASSAIVHTVLSPVALALAILGEKPSNYALQLSRERVNLIGKAVEAESIKHIKNVITNSNSAEELLNFYKKYSKLPGIDTALARAKTINPSYVDSTLPAIKVELAATEKVMAAGVSEGEIQEAVDKEVAEWRQQILNEKFNMDLSVNTIGETGNQQTHLGLGTNYVLNKLFDATATFHEIFLNVSLSGKPNNGLKYPANIKVKYTLTTPVKKVLRGFVAIHDDEIEEEIRSYTLNSSSDVIKDVVKFKFIAAVTTNLAFMNMDKVLEGDPELSVDVIEVSD
jgi:hypothetical protein